MAGEFGYPRRDEKRQWDYHDLGGVTLPVMLDRLIAVEGGAAKGPVANLAALQALPVPDNGEIRQLTDSLPTIDLYFFNTLATSGTPANDATPGFWTQFVAGAAPATGGLLKPSVLDIPALQALLVPEDSEMRQLTGSLPALEFYVFNTAAPAGIAPTDATPGFWSPLDVSGIDTVARANIDAVTAQAAESIPPGGSVFAVDFLWTNNTLAAIIVPATVDEPNLIGAGLTKGVSIAAAAETGGDRLGAFATVAAFPTTRPDTTPLVVLDWVRLTALDLTNVPGSYVWNGATFVLSVADPVAVPVQGLRVGESATFAALPATRLDATPLQIGDYATLTAIDLLNVRGDYIWDGVNYVLSVPDLAAVPVQGLRVGESATFAALPTTRLDATPLEIGDYATLTVVDVVNVPGDYAWDGANYILVAADVGELESDLFNQSVTVDTTITAAEIAAENDKYGVYVSTVGGRVDLTLDAGVPDGSEVWVTVEDGILPVMVIGSGGDTVGGDPDAEINGLATVVFKKLGTNWEIIPISVIKIFELQPQTVELGVVYEYFTIDTSREGGQNAVFSLTTTTNLPIWEVGGVETKSTAFSLPGTGASQRINVWVPIGEGIDFISTDAFITDLNSRVINSGITKVTIQGANQKVDDKVAFPTLTHLIVNNTQSVITDATAQAATGLTDLRIFNTPSLITDATAQAATGLIFLYAYNTPSLITDATAQAATGLTRLLVNNTPSVITDATAQAATGLQFLYVYDTPSVITDATAQAATGLLGLYVYNTASVITDLTAQLATAITDLRVFNTASVITGLSAATASLITLHMQDTNATAVNVDSVLIGFAANPAMSQLFLDGNNQPRTVASDAAFTALDALLGINLKVN